MKPLVYHPRSFDRPLQFLDTGDVAPPNSWRLDSWLEPQRVEFVLHIRRTFGAILAGRSFAEIAEFERRERTDPTTAHANAAGERTGPAREVRGG